MIVDHRTYTVRPGTLRKQLALYEKHGFAAQKRYFGEPLAYITAARAAGGQLRGGAGAGRRSRMGL